MPRVTIHDIKKKSPETAAWLFENYPGFHLDIPKKECSYKYENNDLRDEAIYKMHYSSGMSCEDIASIMELDVQTVRKTLARKYYDL